MIWKERRKIKENFQKDPDGELERIIRKHFSINSSLIDLLVPFIIHICEGMEKAEQELPEEEPEVKFLYAMRWAVFYDSRLKKILPGIIQREREKRG